MSPSSISASAKASSIKLRIAKPIAILRISIAVEHRATNRKGTKKISPRSPTNWTKGV